VNNFIFSIIRFSLIFIGNGGPLVRDSVLLLDLPAAFGACRQSDKLRCQERRQPSGKTLEFAYVVHLFPRVHLIQKTIDLID